MNPWTDPAFEGISICHRVYHERQTRAMRCANNRNWTEAFKWANLAGLEAVEAMYTFKRYVEDFEAGKEDLF